MILLGLLSGLAVLGLGAWLYARVARDAELVRLLDWEVKALREEVRKISAPSQAVPVASSPADASRREASGFFLKGEEAAPPVAFAPPVIHPSKQNTDAIAPLEPIGAAAGMRTGAERPSVDWESFVGVKLFSWIAGVFLTIGAVHFLRYSIDHGWLSPPVQMAIGLLAGIGLLVACELKAARRYAVTANALDAAGLAILFATVFAGHARWNLVGLGLAFLLMAVVAALAVFLALRRDSLFIAALGLLGGFATPALLSTGEDRPVVLFSYFSAERRGFRSTWPSACCPPWGRRFSSSS